MARHLRCASAFDDGVPLARLQVDYNNALTNLDVTQLSSTGGYFVVRAGQTLLPDLHVTLGAALANDVRSWHKRHGNSAMPAPLSTACPALAGRWKTAHPPSWTCRSSLPLPETAACAPAKRTAPICTRPLAPPQRMPSDLAIRGRAATSLCQRLYQLRAVRLHAGVQQHRTRQTGRATAHFHGRILRRARRPNAPP